jgi:hypothetical protein
MTTTFDIVVFHKGCPDGNMGVWALRHSLSTKSRDTPKYVGMIPRKYPKDLDVTGKNVVFIDVSTSTSNTECIN